MIDLACLAQRLRAQGQTLWLTHPQPHIRALIETVGLHRLPAVRVGGGTQPAFAR
jgi:anti-anti-sigma regulatory factor